MERADLNREQSVEELLAETKLRLDAEETLIRAAVLGLDQLDIEQRSGAAVEINARKARLHRDRINLEIAQAARPAARAIN